jgi:hypothetical protein
LAYQHYNRLIAHWQPKIKPEGSGLAFGSKERYRSLTPGAVAVAQFVAQHLNSETNTYPISQKTLVIKLGLAKSTIGLALDELVAWGIFTRERAHYEKPYAYRLAVDCSEDCEHLEIHYTKSELATLPEKQATPSPREQATPSPKNQATGLLNNRQLIESNKEINKEMNTRLTPCSNCSGDYEALPNGKREIIHSHACSELIQIQSGRAWQITQSELESSWHSLDNREQQIANYLSLAKGKERIAKRIESVEVSNQEKEIKFHKIIARTLAENSLENYTPDLLEYLGTIYSQSGDLSESHISRAVNYSKLGWHLKPEGDWRMGGMINSHHFIEGEGSND